MRSREGGCAQDGSYLAGEEGHAREGRQAVIAQEDHQKGPDRQGDGPELRPASFQEVGEGGQEEGLAPSLPLVGQGPNVGRRSLHSGEVHWHYLQV